MPRHALSAVLLLPVLAGAETVEMTTYYPSPSGSYQRITTTQQTVLARDGGNVGVGVANPSQKLDLGPNTAQAGAVILTPRERPSTPAEGMLYSDTDGSLYHYSGGVWGRLLVFTGRILASTSGGPLALTGTNQRVMRLRFRTIKRGIHSLEWDGQVNIANGGNKTATIVVRHCGSSTVLIQRFIVEDPDDSALTVDSEDVGGSTMLNLAANTEYCIEMLGRTKAAGANVPVGAEMRVGELFAF